MFSGKNKVTSARASFSCSASAQAKDMAEENRQLLGNQTESEPEDEIKPHSPPPPYLDPRTGARDIQYKKLPTVIYILEKTGLLSFKPLLR